MENLSLWINDSVAYSKIEWDDGGTSSLNGIGDLKTKISYSMFNNRILTTLGMSFPIGLSRLDKDQIEVANVIYDEVLGFNVNKLGGGFEFNPGIVFAMDSGAIGTSVSASYLLKVVIKTSKILFRIIIQVIEIKYGSGC